MIGAYGALDLREAEICPTDRIWQGAFFSTLLDSNPMANRPDELPNERRANLELRAVIDEMLERVRDFRRLTGAWTREEREQAERELEAIMSRVRSAATKTHKEL
jgi:hypothetical protein